MKPGDIIEWRSDGPRMDDIHLWRIMGIHLGTEGQESVVHVENISHKPAWTGEWETQIAMYIPECLIFNHCIITPCP
jgi:hypothetical protein